MINPKLNTTPILKRKKRSKFSSNYHMPTRLICFIKLSFYILSHILKILFFPTQHHLKSLCCTLKGKFLHFNFHIRKHYIRRMNFHVSYPRLHLLLLSALSLLAFTNSRTLLSKRSIDFLEAT